MKCLIFLLFVGLGHQAAFAQLIGPVIHVVETVLAGCGGVDWVKYNRDQVKESDMVLGGSQGTSNFYICRVVTESGNPAIGFSLNYQGKQYCDYVDSQGVEKQVLDENFEVLITFALGSLNLYWKDSSDGVVPNSGALVAAKDKDNRPIYIAQCPTNLVNGWSCGVRDGYVVGKASTMKTACNKEAPQCKPQKYLMCRSFLGLGK